MRSTGIVGEDERRRSRRLPTTRSSQLGATAIRKRPVVRFKILSNLTRYFI
jgi:hypothetical protein